MTNRGQKRPVRRSGESGFAMLLVFVMAATIAITLYIEVPRIAFESQRTREQMTIDRALQYKRAIQLYYRKYQTFPQSLDDLETTKNIRFLRFRYLDPLTGKPWRLLHVGPAGQLTDSLVQPPPPLPGSSNSVSAMGTGSATGQAGSTTAGTQTAGSTQPANGGQANPSQSNPSQPNPSQPYDPNDPNATPPDPLNMANRRPSDRVIGGPGVPGANGVTNPADPAADPAQQPPESDPNQVQQAQLPGQALPGQTTPGIPGQSIPGLPGQTIPGLPGQTISGLPGQTIPGLPGQTVSGLPGQPLDPNQTVNPADPSQTASQAPLPGAIPIPGQTSLPGQSAFPGQSTATNTNLPYTSTTGQPSVQYPPGFNPNLYAGAPGMPSTQFPQAGGLGSGLATTNQVPGAPTAGQQQSASNLIQQILTTPRAPPSSSSPFTSGNTGGIAGVASTAEGKGIHVINDRSKYKEWEFVYDLKKDKTVVGAAAVNQQNQVQNQMQQNQNGAPGLGGTPSSASPFGSSSSSPFGSSGSSPFGSGTTTSSPAAPSTPSTPPSQ